MKRFITLIIIFFFASSIFAQGINLNQGSIKQKEYLQKIPYQNKAGMLIIPATINGKTYNFLFDTGAPLTISDKLLKEINLPILGEAKIGDSSGEVREMRYISLPELHLNEITFINTTGIVWHEETLKILECLEIDGTIGSNMLKNSVVQIDEQRKHIIIADNIKKISGYKGRFQKMETSPGQSSPFIIIGFQKGKQKAREKVLFDTGAGDFYNMSLGVYNQLNYKAIDVVNKIAESEGFFSGGIHGMDIKQQHLLLNIPKLVIYKMIFNDVVIATTNSSNSRIGSQLLKYGLVTLDYNKKRFYYKPFDNIDTSELSQKPMAILPTLQNDKLVVGIIWDKTLESQINLGDEVLSINGINIQTMSVCELFNFDNTSSNDEKVEELILELKDIKTGETKKVGIKRL